MKVDLHIEYAYRPNPFLYFRPHTAVYINVCCDGFGVIG